MRFRNRLVRRWQFSVTILAPAIACLALMAVAVMAFVIWSTTGTDRRALERETKLVATALSSQFDQIPRAQESVAIWDDAVTNTRESFDKAWLDNNLGVWMRDYYGYDAIAVLDDRNQPIYTMADGEAPAPGAFERNRATIAPLISEIRAAIAAGALERYAEGTADFPHALDIKVVDGRPAVVSVVPIISQTDLIEQAVGTEYLHLVVDYLDQSFADAIAERYLFERAGFGTTASQANLATYAVLNRGGRLATFFEWRPGRPGLELLQSTTPVLIGAFVVTGLLLIMLVNRLWVSSSTLESERRTARHQAAHDPLTGLPNRAEFERGLGRALAKRHRSPVSLLMLDLDRFKQVNDTLGHHAGDALIRAVGQRLRELVGPGDMLARLGGDEFAIIHTNEGGEKDALELADAVIEAISKPFAVSGSEAFVGASIGLAVASDSDDDQQELARKADIALYEAKAAGRNRVLIYAESMNEVVQDRHLMEAELREALKSRKHLSVAFQPLFSSDGEIAGSEALVRWHHPRLGQISPARFIPVAESSGLIEELGDYVLRRSCVFGARWTGRRVAVNISPAQLLNPGFPERVFDLLVETAMRPSDLELEITESILLDDESTAVESLSTLRRAGIRIALDDFGTGYSSLNYLKRYPVDRIKIDRSFVAQLGTGESADAIVKAMVTLAHALNIEVTAEGVETNEQLAILKNMDCNLFQGFLLAAPMPEADLEAEYRDATVRRDSRVA